MGNIIHSKHFLIWKDKSSGAEETPEQKSVVGGGIAPEAFTVNLLYSQSSFGLNLRSSAYHVLLASSRTHIFSIE